MKQIFDSFNKLYIETTDPSTDYTRLFSFDVAISILFHTLFYLILIYIVSFLFSINITKKTYCKLFCFLIITMSSGYVLRLCRVKSLHSFDPKLVDTFRTAYFTFYFFG